MSTAASTTAALVTDASTTSGGKASASDAKASATTEAIRIGTEAAFRKVLAEHRKAVEKKIVVVVAFLVFAPIVLVVLAFFASLFIRS